MPDRKPAAHRRRFAAEGLGAYRAVGIVTGVAGLAAIVTVFLPPAISSGGGMIIVPLIGGVAFMIGITVGWHWVFGEAVHAVTPQERWHILALGAILVALDIAISGWCLATTIGGAQALTDTRRAFISETRTTVDLVAGNAALEAGIVAAVDAARVGLENMANAEDAGGILCSRPGRSVCYFALKSAAASFALTVARVVRQQQQQAADLNAARDALDDAGRNIASDDVAQFIDNAGKATAALRNAAKLRIGVAELGIGLTAPATVQRVIDEALSTVGKVVVAVNGRRRLVPPIEDFQPLEARTAILRMGGEVQAWLCAIAISLLPMFTLFVALLLPRQEEPEAGSDSIVTFERPRIINPAE